MLYCTTNTVLRGADELGGIPPPPETAARYRNSIQLRQTKTSGTPDCYDYACMHDDDAEEYIAPRRLTADRVRGGYIVHKK